MATRVGYAGGTTSAPRYRFMGDHSESLQVDYDPSVIGYADLLGEFWAQHRPTGAAPPRQYASIIFYSSVEERTMAELSRAAAESRIGPVHTRIEPFGGFHLAEKYHQKYYKKRGLAGLCAAMSRGAAG
ncbi:MAG: peptide-methionine (S)-S-oxide reductase [Coriobacteriia bacterium]|nr:peptide-methionine (S)-S-oxide reductase [Coriobacteriia bacterium]MBN2839365.1 peptide-methionine (S)-S-oxide reductase [Coriobacteriia bacterium]